MSYIIPRKKSKKYPMHLSNDSLKVYYARAMDGIDQSEIIEDDIKVKSSLEEKGFSIVNPYQEHDLSLQQARTLVKDNIALLKKSDVLIANLSRKHYTYVGAIFEIIQAVNLEIPVVIYIGNSDLGNRYYFHYYCDFICNTIEEAVTYIWRCLSSEGIVHQINEEKTYYNQIASNYEKLSSKIYQNKYQDIDRYKKEREQLKEKLKDYCRDKTVLELGCGTGDWTQHIVEVAKSVVCIDASQNMLHRAEERFQKSPIKPYFIRGDFLDETLNIEPCDVIVSYFTLSFLPPFIQYNLLSIIKRWAKKNGYYLFAESMNIASIPSIGLGHRRIQKRTANRKEYLIYKEHFPPDRLVDLLDINGFKIIELSRDVHWFTFSAVQRD